MKNIYLIAVLFVGIISSQAQTSNNSKPAKELKWHTNVKEALAVSNKENKPLLLFFTGSDWCGWCIRLQKEVLKTAEFEKWAAENVVLVELDYPRKNTQTAEIKKQNNELQEAFSIQGFPTVLFANGVEKDGKVNLKGIGSVGYVPGGPVAWLEVANGIVKTNK